MTAIEIQVLYAEAECFRCLSGASDTELLRLALLARITEALGVSGASVYTAQLTQSGVAAPTAVVLNNTIGAIVWTYASTGLYIGTLTGAFPTNLTFVMINQSAGTASGFHFEAFRSDANTIRVSTKSFAGAVTDSVLADTSIEIRVYS